MRHHVYIRRYDWKVEMPSDDHAAPRRDSAVTRARLLDAARELFLRQGYRATGLREVSARAGVDVTLVRRYARWHEALRFALLAAGAAAFRLTRALFRGAAERRMEWLFVRGACDALRGRPIPFAELGMTGSAVP